VAIATGPDTAPTPRRRRSPQQARHEILDAAAALLAQSPSHDVTVSAIMSRTTLSRKSFYVYFRDRADLLASLLAPLRAQTDAAVERWRAAPEMIQSGRAALRDAAFLYHRHGAILRALVAASQHDADAAEVWRTFIEPVITVAAEKIAEATGPEADTGLDPQATARALVGMNVHYFIERLVGAPASEIDPTVTTLTAIWERTLFLRPPRP